MSEISLIFLHGWGHTADNMRPLGVLFEQKFACHYINLPGFGGVMPPQDVWGAEDYADYIADYCIKNTIKKAIVIGHSFGGKTALMMAVRHPDLIAGVIGIASAGLKKKRSVFFKIKALILRLMGKSARLFDGIFKTDLKEKYGRRFGSADYRAATGIMKKILVKTVSGDMRNDVKNITAPCLFIYGENDTATPSYFGDIFKASIPHAQKIELPEQDHYSVLQAGRFQCHPPIKKFINNIFNPH